MTLEEYLHLLLMPCTTGKVYPDVRGPEPTEEYIVYTQIGGDAPGFIDRTIVSKRNTLMQINCWAPRRKRAIAMGLAVESALTLATTVQASAVAAQRAALDDESDLRGVQQDFSIWSDR